MASLLDLGGQVANNTLQQLSPENLLGMDVQRAQLDSYQQAQRLAQAEAQRAAQQRAVGEQAISAAIAAPTPQNILAATLRNPQIHEAIKGGYDVLHDDQKAQTLGDWATTFGNLQAGNTEAAKAPIVRRIAADKKAGQPTADDEAMLAQIDKDAKAATAVAGLHLAAAMGPDKFTEAYGKVNDVANANAELPGKMALTAARTAEAQANADEKLRPKPKTAAIAGPDGNPIFYDQNAPPPAGGFAGGGGSPALAALIPNLIQSESGGSATAKNPNSSATGAGQFVKGTWLEQVKGLRPDLADGKTDAQILAMRSDPQLSAQITTAYAQQNANALGAAGLPVNGATLAMAHKLGPGGAQAVLGADPNAKLSTVLPAEVIKANPQLANQTAGQYATGLAKRFGTDPINVNVDPSATGEEFLATLPPPQAKLVKAIANGDVAMPSGSRMTPRAQALMTQVLQYDPTATAVTLPTRMATRKAFTTGVQGQAVTAGNTVGAHLAGLDAAIDQLDNTPVGIFNKPAQVLGEAVGNKATQKALGNFDFFKHAVADELMKVFRGSNGSEAEAQGWLKQLDSAKSPVQLHATVRAMAQGINSRLDQLEYSYQQGMGKGDLKLFNPHSTAALKSLAGEGGQAPSRMTATNAQGQTVTYDPASRQWVPG